MTEQVQINRKEVYITIDIVRVRTENRVEEMENQYVGFFKLEPPNEILGEQIKDGFGNNLVFNSREQARNEIIKILKRRIYPPSLLRPLEYTSDNLPEIMHKELIFDIGKFESDQTTETIQGMITGCTLASNPSNLPAYIRIMTNNGEKRFSIMEVKRIRYPN